MSQLYSVKEAAALLKVHVDSVYSYIKNGLLKADQPNKPKGSERRGRHEYRIREEYLDEFLHR